MSITTDADWWRSAVIYQMYPKSWADSDGDGFGDIAGIRGRLAHLARLGVDAVWFSPWYTSPQADGGYDVADFRGIDPMFGDVADVEALVAEAHDLGIKVIVDIVPNHSFRPARVLPGGAGLRARVARRGSATTACAARRRRQPAERLARAFRRLRVGPDPRRRGSSPAGGGTCTCSTPRSRTSTGTTPTSGRTSRRPCASGSTGASTGSASTWPRAWPRLPGYPPSGEGRRCSRRSARSWTSRSGTSRPCTRSGASGAGSPTPTTRPRVFVGEVWVATRGGAGRLPPPRRAAHGLQLRLPQVPLGRRGAARGHRPLPAHLAPGRRPDDVGPGEPRRPARPDQVRGRGRGERMPQSQTAPPCPTLGPDDAARLARARAGLLLHARPARLGLPVPGPGAGPGGGGRPAGRGPARTRRSAARGRAGLPRRLPRPDAVDPEGASFGFSPTGASWLPMPAHWGGISVEAQTGDPASTLELTRRLLRLRRAEPALGDGDLDWISGPGRPLPGPAPAGLRRGSARAGGDEPRRLAGARARHRGPGLERRGAGAGRRRGSGWPRHGRLAALTR